MKFFYNSNKYNDSKALGYAETINPKLNIQDLSKESLTRTQIAELAERMNVSINELVDRNDDLYISDYKDKDLSDKEWLKAMEEKPTLIKTPIAMTSEKTFYVDDPYKFVKEDMSHGGIKEDKANKDER